MELDTNEYIANRGEICPFCGGRHVSPDSIELEDGTSCYRICRCDKCNKRWNECYALTNIEEIKETEVRRDQHGNPVPSDLVCISCLPIIYPLKEDVDAIVNCNWYKDGEGRIYVSYMALEDTRAETALSYFDDAEPWCDNKEEITHIAQALHQFNREHGFHHA